MDFSHVVLSGAIAAGAVWHWWRVRNLKRILRRMMREARHDALTSLLNRRGFEEAAHRIVAHHLRSGEPWTVLIIDLDGFKGVNDTFGHEAGDHVLREAAQRIMRTVRTADVVARLGGDEFALLLPGTEEAGAHITVARLNEALRDRFFLPGGYTVRLSASMGVCTRCGAGEGDPTQKLAEALRVADKEMYRRKKGEG